MSRKIKNIHPFRNPTARELLKIADRVIADAEAEDIPMPIERGPLADLLASGVQDLFRARNDRALKDGVL